MVIMLLGAAVHFRVRISKGEHLRLSHTPALKGAAAQKLTIKRHYKVGE